MIAFKADQAGGRDTLAHLDEAVIGDRQRHQCSTLLSPDIGIGPGQRAISGLMPLRDATLFQPVIQRGKIGKVRHALQHLMTGVADVLLDLTFLPPRRWIAKVWLEDIVIRYRQEADIDVPRLAAAHEINRRLHVVIVTALRHAAKEPERMPMGIEQHLMGLQGYARRRKARLCDSLIWPT